MREIAHDADAVHLRHDLMAEVGQAAIHALVASGRAEVLRVVGHLRDADAAILEQLHVADLVLEGGDVLEAQNDAGPAGFLGASSPPWCAPA